MSISIDDDDDNNKKKNFFSDDAGNLNDVTNRAKQTTDKSVSHYYSENIDDHCCLEYISYQSVLMVDVSAVFEKLVDDIDVAFSSGSLQRSGRGL